MNDELLGKIVLILEICSPILTGLTILYFRLSSRIDKTEAKSETRVDELRKEVQALDNKMEQRFMHMEQKLEQKFERVDQKFEKIDQKFDRLFEMLVIRSQLGRGNPLKKTK
ncbi:hypothetical protein [Candidatus Finniella inopinata]|uniref:Uncharacterized protein n=1 Tax=Candidatus Finniella inopinata TaxID=1696036 RepID=A0A4Q7DH77_9PROT|nr:hypothetical protein [Candidatus Finniella inopinata]RZI45479.1 hypothetical protein EQU50_06965 [Candidatus Finniella inopinata]